MAEMTEGKRTGEFIQREQDGTLSRDRVTVTVAAATKLVPGQVLGKIASSGKYIPFDETLTNGAETAAGILYAALDNEAGVAPADFDEAVIINFGAEVREADLEWGTADDSVGLPQLRALFIKAR